MICWVVFPIYLCLLFIFFPDKHWVQPIWLTISPTNGQLWWDETDFPAVFSIMFHGTVSSIRQWIGWMGIQHCTGFNPYSQDPQGDINDLGIALESLQKLDVSYALVLIVVGIQFLFSRSQYLTMRHAPVTVMMWMLLYTKVKNLGLGSGLAIDFDNNWIMMHMIILHC